MMRPPRLLKYMPKPLFLDNGCFRFTQPTGLDDPEEARPRLQMNQFAPEDIAEARETTRRAGFENASDDQLIVLALTPYPSGRFDERSFPGLWPTSEPRLRPKPFETIEELDRAIAERAIELTMDYADRTVGIFSLSAQTSEEIWARYADEHHGICVEFDPDHPYFENVRPVTYSDQPVSMSVNNGWVRLAGVRLRTEDILSGNVGDPPDELIWRKTTDWSRQMEWRMAGRLANATLCKPPDRNGFAVCLFAIPPTAIRALTFGYRASAGGVNDALTLIDALPHWHHLSVRKRVNARLGMRDEVLRDGS